MSLTKFRTKKCKDTILSETLLPSSLPEPITRRYVRLTSNVCILKYPIISVYGHNFCLSLSPEECNRKQGDKTYRCGTHLLYSKNLIRPNQVVMLFTIVACACSIYYAAITPCCCLRGQPLLTLRNKTLITILSCISS